MADELPKGIGPHEGRELELMLAGEKPLARFSDVYPSPAFNPVSAFDPYVQSGKLIKREVEALTSDGKYMVRSVYYALPDEEWRIDRMVEIDRGFSTSELKTSPELEWEIGRLFGYDEADIQVFIDRWFADKV